MKCLIFRQGIEYHFRKQLIKTILFIAISCGGLNFSFAQQFDVDSLKEELRKHLEDHNRVVTLNALAFMYFEVNPDSALPLIEEAIFISKKNNDSSGLASCDNAVGWLYYMKGKSDTALQLITKASNFYEKTNDRKNLALAYANLAQILFRGQKNYVSALDYATKAAAINESTKDSRNLVVVYTIIGTIYRDQQQYPKAIAYYNQAIALAETINDKHQLGNIYTGIGILYLRKNDLTEAVNYFTQSFNLAEETNRPYGKAIAKENLGDAYAALNDFSRALYNYQYALNYFRASGLKEDWGYECINVGKMHHALKNYEQAIATFQLAAQLFDETGSRGYLPELYEALSNTFSAKGDYKNALVQYQLYIAERDSIFSREQKRQLAELTTKYYSEQKEKENLLLKAQNTTTTIKLQRNQAWLTAAGVSCIMLLALSYFIYRNRQAKIKNISTLKKLNEQLSQQKETISDINSILELRALRSQMSPHFIFNCMSSIQECILTGEIDDANKYLSRLSRLLRMVLEYSEFESVSLDKELEMLELYLQLESIRMKENFHYTISVDESIFREEIQVPTLILQPFAENAIWHGLLPKKNNRELKITIEQSGDSLNCIIEDNGIGREKSEALQHLRMHHRSKGISIISDRLNILKQRSHYSQTGYKIIDLYTGDHIPTGTQVIIKLPLDSIPV